jgi:broad specificity phosphatase PhoE
MQIEFVRHTETNYNVLHLLNDVPHENVYLTEKGIKDAGKIANNLKTFPAKKIYTSEFPRCKHVAEIIAKYHKAPIVVSSLINECKFGDMDGQESRILREAIASMKDLPGVERPSHIQKRVIEFLEQVGEDCIVVTHKAVMRVLQMLIHNIPFKETKNMNFTRITITDKELRKILK